MRNYVIIVAAVVALVGCKTAPPVEPCSSKLAKRIVPTNLVKPNKKAKTGKKNYLVWNKKQFLKPKGLVTMSKSTIFALAEKFGAENMKPMEYINGFTVKNADKALTITSDEWQVQEEVEYQILDTLYKIEKVEVNTAPCPTCPSCPVDPTPMPTPNPDPGPVMDADKSWGRTRLRAREAMMAVNTSGVVIANIDTGIDMSHTCKGNVIATKSFTGEAVQDLNSHGTHTAGTIAGGCGVGVSKAKLVVCKGLSNDGSGSSTSLAQCLAWAGQQGAKIVSNSWGSTQSDPLINKAISDLTDRGIAVVVANGNDGRPTLNWPAALGQTDRLVFGVSASDKNDRRASFSTYGPGTKFIAPGVDIVSNKPGGGVQIMSGTSMSAPHVAGAMALCVARGLPFTLCLKTDNINLPQNQQGAGIPRMDLSAK